MANNATLITPVRAHHSRNSGTLKLPRYGVGIHFDDSSNDVSGEEWFQDPACGVSYNRLYLDNGDVSSIADDDREAWHFGICLPPNNFNHTLYGLAAATNANNVATKKCVESMCEDVTRIFRYHGWPAVEIPERIIGHDEKAIFNKKDNPTRPDLWGKLGRRIDPTGHDAKSPIINIESMQIVVALLLKGRSADYDPAPLPGEPVPRVRPVLRRGATGTDVADLQRMLGLKVGNGIGTFGPVTEAAVRSFQRQQRLTVDGIAGAQVWRALEGR